MRSSRALSLTALSALAVAGLVAASALPASAAGDVSTGQWYLDAFHIRDVQADGLTGTGVTIAVIDSAINTSIPALASADITVREPSYCLGDDGSFLPAVSTDLTGPNDAFHGTSIAALLVGSGAGSDGQQGVQGIAPGAKLLYYAASTSTGVGQAEVTCRTENGSAFGIDESVAAAMNEAMDAGADIISVSLLLNGNTEMIEAVARAHREGVIILGGIPNEQVSQAGIWPGAANGAVAVQAVDATGAPQSEDVAGTALPIEYPYTSVSGPGMGILAQGVEEGTWDEQQLVSGTSYATPAIAGFLALVKQQFPSATGNQLLQTLIRNTGATDHELVRDDALGFGIASVTHMLQNDPAQYPDENPLITPDGIPSPEEIAGTPSPTPTDDPGQGGQAPAWILPVVIGVVGGLVLIAVIIVIVLVAVRRSRGGALP